MAHCIRIYVVKTALRLRQPGRVNCLKKPRIHLSIFKGGHRLLFTVNGLSTSLSLMWLMD